MIRRAISFGGLVWKLAKSPRAREQLRLILGRQPIPAPPVTSGPDFVDVKTLLTTLSIEELNETSDEYFRQHSDIVPYLGRPFSDVSGTSDQLITFAQVMNGLDATPGSDVLDFGAGTCWSTRFLTLMGHAVTAMDVSRTALEIGQELFRRQPVVGFHVAPKFVVFDGRRFDLPDEIFHHIVCLNAFHHVPNPADVLKEMARVLRPGGIAGFSEPGEGHSRSAQAQYEMRNFRVIENDIDIDDIERWAMAAGFNRLELAVVDPSSYRLAWPEYSDLIAGGLTAERYVDAVRVAAWSRRLFFLHKPGALVPDSRLRRGLSGVVRIAFDTTHVTAGEPLRGEACVQNTGANRWLPSDAPVGAVLIGVHLSSRDGRQLDHDFARVALPRPLQPGESATFRFSMAAPAPGDYKLGFDLVSERICWFAETGAAPLQVDVSVAPADRSARKSD